MASTPRLAAGTLFAGDYRILGPLAEGGMGSVYRAEQQSTRKVRALKVVHGRLLDDERSRARFVREATIGASIASEHVVEVIGAGIDPATELPYLAMELLDGGDLAAVVRHRGRLTPGELGALLRQLCHGLGAAHVAKVVHRDLKPAWPGLPKKQSPAASGRESANSSPWCQAAWPASHPIIASELTPASTGSRAARP